MQNAGTQGNGKRENLVVVELFCSRWRAGRGFEAVFKGNHFFSVPDIGGA
jgi:hypothetical protein